MRRAEAEAGRPPLNLETDPDFLNNAVTPDSKGVRLKRTVHKPDRYSDTESAKRKRREGTTSSTATRSPGKGGTGKGGTGKGGTGKSGTGKGGTGKGRTGKGSTGSTASRHLNISTTIPTAVVKELQVLRKEAEESRKAAEKLASDNAKLAVKLAA